MENIQDTLTERGKHYGEFLTHAGFSQALKQIWWQSPGFQKTIPLHREAMEMIMHKIARIMNGDPNYDDSWRDIAGYAQLVVDGIKKVEVLKEEQARKNAAEKEILEKYKAQARDALDGAASGSSFRNTSTGN